jgi:hypothetical protein
MRATARHRHGSHPFRFVCGARLAALLLIFITPRLSAKDAPLLGIELYVGKDGPAYLQIAEILVDGKTELRGCIATTKIDKSSYGKLPKIVPGSGDALEYGQDGTLLLTKDGHAACVLPENLKFERDVAASPADLASEIPLQGKILMPASAANAIPPLRPGVKLVFASESDAELPSYLLADWASTIPLWRDYLAKFPSSPHTAAAKQSLTSLLVKDGAASLQKFQQASASTSPSFPDLKSAKTSDDQALSLVPGDALATKLGQDVQAEIQKLLDTGAKLLEAYKAALSSHTAGYRFLVEAQSLASATVGIVPDLPAAKALDAETSQAMSQLDDAVHAAYSLLPGKKFDEAVSAVSLYASFAGEDQRIEAILEAASAFHVERARGFARAEDWDGAVSEYGKAAEIKPTPETAKALADAKANRETANTRKAADAALKRSGEFEAQGQYIQAYEVLADLPAPQLALVKSDLGRLGPQYTQAASDTALSLEMAHDPIKGLADELEIERAYGYLQRAYALGNDASIKDRADNLANKLSDFYLQEGRRYLNKPLASGAGVGWSYLNKALQFRASNYSEVRDEMTRAASAYQMRSRLSVRVAFRDQTSRRDSVGFADQLADAIATGLETSGLPVRVIRPGETPAVEPNFQLIGDVLQHARAVVSTSDPKDSKYRAGEMDAPNEDWNKANRDGDTANQNLQGAQAVLQAAIAKGNKKNIADATARVADAQKILDDARKKLDSIPKTVPVDVIKPYTYTEKSTDLSAVVQLQFRINDSTGNPVEGTVPVSRERNKKFSILENVKPEDTEGVKVEGTVPDEIQFLTDVENDARDALITSVKEKIAGLPAKILAQAKQRADDGDTDGAAESYILYLNSTPSTPTADRESDERFLLEQFNIRPGNFSTDSGH